MALLCVHVLRGSRFCSLSAHLTRNFQVCKQAGHPVKKADWSLSSQSSCHTFDFRATRAGTLLSLQGKAGTVCHQISPKITSPLQSSSVLMQHGYSFHTSAPVRALPAPLIWMLLKPLQKLLAIILGR